MVSVKDYRDYGLSPPESYDYVDYYEFQPSRAQAECELAREEWAQQLQGVEQLQGAEQLKGAEQGIYCPPHWDRLVNRG